MRFIGTILLIFLCFDAFSQSEIYYMDGSRKEIEIMRKNRDMVIYKDSGDYKPKIAYASQIRLLRIAEGTYYTYNGERLSLDSLSRGDFVPIMVAFDWMSPVTGRGKFWAQYITPNGLFGVRVPVSIGFKGEFSNPKKIDWETGFNAMVFPNNQERWSYFTGLGLRFGDENKVLHEACLFEPCPEQVTIESTYWGVYGLNGVVFTPFKHIAFSGSAGIGYRSSKVYGNDLHMIAELSVGVQFGIDL